MFKSYWYVCTNCDASIEVVSKGIHFQDPTCNCHDSQVVWCQTNVVESSTTNERNTMLDNLEASMDGMTTENLPLSDAEKYNPNLLVTYKVIHGYSDAEYVTDKVTSIEYELHNGRQNSKVVVQYKNKVDVVKDIITEAYADSDDQDTLRAIAEALDIELTKTVEFTATIEVAGTMEIDLLSDYGDNLEDEVTDNLYVDSQSGRIEITETEISYVREC
jgi:predicted RNA-binding Zn-ribbon protein involved in translation (DUF1610 family)